MDGPCFDALRTAKQLGYSVDCSTYNIHGVVGFAITIGSQASKFTSVTFFILFLYICFD